MDGYHATPLIWIRLANPAFPGYRISCKKFSRSKPEIKRLIRRRRSQTPRPSASARHHLMYSWLCFTYMFVLSFCLLLQLWI